MKKALFHVATLCALVGTLVYLTSFSRDENKKLTDIKNSVDLGEMLFKDPVLSGDRTVSCASCHNPELAFADTTASSVGVNHQLTGRNTPTAMYLENNKVFFWDGRAHSLEQQASGPITNKKEMNLALTEAVVRLNESELYRDAFMKIYGRKPDSALLLQAIASFERSISVHDSPYDHFLKGDDQAMSDAAIRGFQIFFREKACGNSACHKGINFNSDSLVNIGVYGKEDQGLYDLTKNTNDIGKFKSPTLRNVAITYPYMHNGMHKTLREVVDYYNNEKNFPVSGTTHPDVKDPRGKMNEQQLNDLVEFLKALTDYRYLKKANG